MIRYFRTGCKNTLPATETSTNYFKIKGNYFLSIIAFSFKRFTFHEPAMYRDGLSRSLTSRIVWDEFLGSLKAG